MARKDCPYRITNVVGQHICGISSYYMRGCCCEQVGEETCKQMREIEEREYLKQLNERE